MEKIIYSNRMMHRGRYSKLLLFSIKEKTIIEFNGYSIEGICVVLNEDYTKNGKWSGTTYEIGLAKNIKAYRLEQDWNNREYFPQNNWADAYNEFIKLSEFNELSFDVFKSYVRAYFKSAAQRLDATDRNIETLKSDILRNEILRKEQLKQEILAEIQKKEAEIEKQKAIELAKKEAEEIAQKTNKIKEKLNSSKSMNLEQLKEIYNKL